MRDVRIETVTRGPELRGQTGIADVEMVLELILEDEPVRKPKTPRGRQEITGQTGIFDFLPA